MELSPKDKQLLDSFDISIFKSAVAYLENARHSSCQPVKSSDFRQTHLKKLKIPKEKIPPLHPFESRFEVLSKKYGNEVNSAKIRPKQGKRKDLGIFHSKIGLENEEDNDWKSRYSGMSRKHLKLFKGSR
jgi:hypothetical protein